MPLPLLTTSAQVKCMHSAPATGTPIVPLVYVNGQPVLTERDPIVVTGCPFNVSGSPVPCVTIENVQTSAFVSTNGAKVLLATPVGTCRNAAKAPQGVPIVVPATPTTVLAT